MTGTETNPIRVLKLEHVQGARNKTIYYKELSEEIMDNWGYIDKLCKQNKVKIEVVK